MLIFPLVAIVVPLIILVVWTVDRFMPTGWEEAHLNDGQYWGYKTKMVLVVAVMAAGIVAYFIVLDWLSGDWQSSGWLAFGRD